MNINHTLHIMLGRQIHLTVRLNNTSIFHTKFPAKCYAGDTFFFKHCSQHVYRILRCKEEAGWDIQTKWDDLQEDCETSHIDPPPLLLRTLRRRHQWHAHMIHPSPTISERYSMYEFTEFYKSCCLEPCKNNIICLTVHWVNVCETFNDNANCFIQYFCIQLQLSDSVTVSVLCWQGLLALSFAFQCSYLPII